MDITPYVEALRRDLGAASEAIGPEGRAVADRMLLALEPALRLTVMELLSQAAAEITSELPAGVVEVRLRGREPELAVHVPTGPQPPEPPRPPSPPGPADESEEAEDEGTIARVTLRIPESVKTRAEDIAARGGLSLNSWIVAVLRAATSSQPPHIDIDLTSIPFPGGRGRRMTGWI